MERCARPPRTPEEIKVEYGVAKQLLADATWSRVEVPGLGDRPPRMLSAARRWPGVIESARRGDLLAGAPGGARVGLRRRAVVGHRADRRHRGDVPGMVELGEGHLSPSPSCKGLPTYSGALFDMVANPQFGDRFMGLLEEARVAHSRGHTRPRPRPARCRRSSARRGTGSWGISDGDERRKRRHPHKARRARRDRVAGSLGFGVQVFGTGNCNSI